MKLMLFFNKKVQSKKMESFDNPFCFEGTPNNCKSIKEHIIQSPFPCEKKTYLE